jgi:hypothetical protein
MFRVRAVQLALTLAATGLMTAIAAAAIGTQQAPAGDGAMAALVMAQKIAAGTLPATGTAPPSPASTTPPKAGSGWNTPMSPEKEAIERRNILAEATALETQMKVTIDHTDKLRIAAYNAKDIVRLNTITNKLDEMKQIMAIAAPAFAAIREPGQDLFVMRSKMATLRQGWDQMKEALAQAESAEGDSVDFVSSIGAEPGQTNPSASSTDPAAAGTPTADGFDRPAQASTFK